LAKYASWPFSAKDRGNIMAGLRDLSNGLPWLVEEIKTKQQPEQRIRGTHTWLGFSVL